MLFCVGTLITRLPRKTTTHRSHMIPTELQHWEDMLSSLHAEDLWLSTRDGDMGYTYRHNAFTHYWARLDRWYLLHAQQYASFTCALLVDHSRIECLNCICLERFVPL